MKFNSGSYGTVIGFKPDGVHIASAVTVSTVTVGGVSATCPLFSDKIYQFEVTEARRSFYFNFN